MNEPTNFLTSPLKNCALALLAAAAMSGASLAQFNKPPETGRVVEPRTRLESDDTVSAAAFSPDGKALVTSNGRALKFWDAATGRLKKTADFHAVNCPDCHRRRITFIAFSPDGRTVVTGAESLALLWDVP